MPHPASRILGAAPCKGACTGKVRKAPSGVGNTGASRQACMGYATSNKSKGNSHSQAGTPLPCPINSTLNGNPPATKTRRHDVSATPGNQVTQTPSTIGRPSVAHKGASAARKAMAKAQGDPR